MRPLSLTSIRREIFGKTDLLELELAINQKIQNLQEVKTGEEHRKLLRVRFETIARLYNLKTHLRPLKPTLSTNSLPLPT